MKQKKYFSTKAGGLTIAFFVIMIAFVLIVTGLQLAEDGFCLVGFMMIIAAMLYSPVKEQIIKKYCQK